MKLKYLLFLPVLIMLLLGAYIFEYQRIVNLGSAIADKQCLKVNPLIIARKQSYLAEMQVVLASRGATAVQTQLKKYLQYSKKFAEAEKNWLQDQQAFTNSWEYNLFAPPNIKRLGIDQYVSRKADMQSSIDIVEMMNTNDRIKQRQLGIDDYDLVKKGEAADADYSKIWNQGMLWYDIGSRLTKIPPSKCPSQNFNIPDTSNIFKSLTPTQTPQNTTPNT